MEPTEMTTKTKWAVDPNHTEVGFKVKHLMVSNVRGRFSEFDANIYTAGEDFTTAEIDFWLNAASISTGNEKRDAHLRSADFFDVEQFTELRFKATDIFVKQGNKYAMYGELTMKGIKKRIELDIEFGGIIKDPSGNNKAILNVTGKINRKDWALNWNAALETGGVMVSENVWIDCDVELTKQS